MATSALATAFVNIVPGTVELEKYLRGKLGDEVEGAGVAAGKKLASGMAAGFKQAGQKITDVGKTMSLSITAPLTAIGLKSIKTAAEFEVSMASLQVNSGASGAAIEKMRELAVKMGQDTVFSAGEAANAMLELSKGGMAPAEISGGALQATMALAATENMGLAEAATIVTQSMNTFGIEAKDTMSAVDLLAAGAVASTAGVYDLAAGMKFVGASASQLGMPMSDTVTALAALNNAGIDSTTAGTSLNRMLLGLIPSTKKSREAMKDLGVDFVNADGTVKGLGEVIDILGDKMTGLGDAEKMTYLKNMFGVEGMRAAATLLELNTDGWTELNDQVTKSGVASELSNARMSGLAGAIEQMKGSIDTAFLAVGDRLTPATEAVTKFITDFVNGFASLPASTQQAIVNFALVAAAVGPVLVVTGQVVTSVGAIITGFSALSTFVSANVIPMMTRLWLAMSANPIGAVITIVAALVAGLTYFFTQTEIGKKAWAGFTKFLEDAWKNVSKFLEDSWKNIKSFFKSSIDFVTKLFLDWTVFGIIIKNWDNIVKFFEDLPANFARLGRNIIDGLLNGLKKGWDTVLGWVTGAAENVAEAFKKVLGIQSPSKVFYSYGEFIGDGLIEGIKSKTTQVTKTVSDFGRKVKQTFEDTVESKFTYSAEPTFINAANGMQFDVNQAAMVWNDLVDYMGSQSAVEEAFGGTLQQVMDKITGTITIVNPDGTMTGIAADPERMETIVARAEAAGKTILQPVAATIEDLIASFNSFSQQLAAAGVGFSGIKPAEDPLSWMYDAAFADGGFVTGPTRALIGEAGPEVVTPLKDFERMMGISEPKATVNYYAAPNQSLDSEEALIQAMRRASVVAAW